MPNKFERRKKGGGAGARVRRGGSEAGEMDCRHSEAGWRPELEVERTHDQVRPVWLLTEKNKWIRKQPAAARVPRAPRSARPSSKSVSSHFPAAVGGT